MPASFDDQDQGPDKGDLAQRLEEAKRRMEPSPKASATGVDDSMGIGMRSGVEFIAAIVVSVGIGFALDHWLGTTPLMLLIMLALGFAAGLLNVWRAMNGMSYGATYKSKSATPKDEA